MTSVLDLWRHEFHCATCLRPFQFVLRTLLQVSEVTCPHCGTQMDIRESKSAGEVGKDFDVANRVDLRAREGAAKAPPQRVGQ